MTAPITDRRYWIDLYERGVDPATDPEALASARALIDAECDRMGAGLKRLRIFNPQPGFERPENVLQLVIVCEKPRHRARPPLIYVDDGETVTSRWVSLPDLWKREDNDEPVRATYFPYDDARRHMARTLSRTLLDPGGVLTWSWSASEAATVVFSRALSSWTYPDAAPGFPGGLPMNEPLPECPFAGLKTEDETGDPVPASWVIPGGLESVRPLFDLSCPYCREEKPVNEDIAARWVEAEGAPWHGGEFGVVSVQRINRVMSIAPTRR